MGIPFNKLSAEGLLGLAAATLAVALDYYWWIRLPLAIVAVAIIWHLLQRIEWSTFARFAVGALLTTGVAFGSGHSIAAGIATDWPAMRFAIWFSWRLASALAMSRTVQLVAVGGIALYVGFRIQKLRDWITRLEDAEQREKVQSYIGVAFVALVMTAMLAGTFWFMFWLAEDDRKLNGDLARAFPASASTKQLDAEFLQFVIRETALETALQSLCHRETTNPPAECHLIQAQRHTPKGK